jgi:hypothetical protein
MTVKELVAELSSWPDDAQVLVSSKIGELELYEIHAVTSSSQLDAPIVIWRADTKSALKATDL